MLFVEMLAIKKVEHLKNKQLSKYQVEMVYMSLEDI